MGLGFKSWGEVYSYAAAIMCGLSMLLPINAIFSAPLYIMNYYQYVMHDPDAVAKHKNFWDNALTYYSMLIMLVALIVEPLTLSEAFRRIPIRLRMLSALSMFWLEIIILMSVPAAGSTEVGAISAIVCASFSSALGKSVFESTAYGLFGVFPSRFNTALMGGVGVAGALASILQLIVKASLPQDYSGIRTQSKIYYGLMAGIHAITFIMVVGLHWVPFAQRYINALSGGTSSPASNNPDQAAESETEAASKANEKSAPKATNGGDDNADSGRLVNTNVIFVLKCVYPMLSACGFNFFITLFLFPTIVVSVDPDDYWYGTVAVCIFNVCDVCGRFSPSLKCLWPPRWVVLVGSFSRVVFVPLLILASYHYIPSHAYNYVMMVIFGLSNGYIGALAITLGPLTRNLETSGQRFVAGTMFGISILIGGTIGSALSILVQTVRG
ncbi:putative nucleobase transporter [Trypanosoma cruzi]|uniref:Putative nucleobase transporter n=1 Tax=Trypanosoma cruzi TaxID=5693 RepID=A0A2V2WDF3_TRYCR|nr:putative nucleobase transporter [Trypanosoma cruzi]